MAEVIKRSRHNRQVLAVHCLAGIGRTSTMLLAAHLILGEDLEVLKKLIAGRNPTFALLGSQAEFIQRIAESPFRQ